MAFVTVEDLYGSVEVIVFDSAYSRCSNLLVNDNVVLVEGRLSLKEDEEPKIVVNNIKDFTSVEETKVRSGNLVKINITDLTDEQKKRLNGAIKFFSGDFVNCRLVVIDNDEEKPCGAVYMTEEILKQFKEIVR